MRFTRRIAGLVAGSLFAIAASAHHSFAAFDLSKTTQIEGVLTEVRLVNPHSFLEVEVVGADESARGQARTRWKEYRQAGLSPQALDLSSRNAG